jgi:putative permease
MVVSEKEEKTMKHREKLHEWLLKLGILTLTLASIWLIKLVFGNFIARFMDAFVAILLPFSIALFISYLVAPLFRFMEKKLHFKYRIVNTILLFVAAAVLFFFFARYIGILIYEQGVTFIEEDWPDVSAAVEEFFNSRDILVPVYDRLQSLLSFDVIETIPVDYISVFESISTILITIVLVPVFLFFILNDRQRIYESLMAMVPKKYRYHAIELTKRANYVTEQYFNGRFATMIIMTIISSIVFFIMGFGERSIFFGFMIGFFDIVPYIGPFIGSLVPFLYSLTDSNLDFGDLAPIMTLVIVIILQVLENNLLQPIIMSNETKIHPLLVLSAFIFFGYLLGVVGIILAIPITGMLRSTAQYIKEQRAPMPELEEEEKEHLRERPSSTKNNDKREED